jgi:hypothetical protein
MFMETSRRRSPSTVNFADLGTQGVDLPFGEVLDLGLLRDTSRRADASRTGAADAIDRRQRNDCVLTVWDVDASNTGHREIS